MSVFSRVLLVVPSLRGPSREWRNAWSFIGPSNAIVVEGMSDIVQARNLAASYAALRLDSMPADSVVCWLDDDVIGSPELMQQHLRILDAAAAAGAGAVSGRYVSRRNPQELACTRDAGRSVLRTSAADLEPVFAGLGCLAQTAESFLEQFENAPIREQGSEPVEVRIMCCPQTEPVDGGRVRYFAEDYDYCSKVPGGVYLAPSAVRYGHVCPMVLYPEAEPPTLRD
jgi:hypothetical protein